MKVERLNGETLEREKIQSEPCRNTGSLEEQETARPNLDIKGNPIDPIWAATFRGFFWGEGMLTMQKWQGRKSFAVYARIQVRADDIDVLCEFQTKLGGRIRHVQNPGGNSKPVAQWQVSALEDCIRLASVLNDPLNLPFNKRKQLALWMEALHLKQINRREWMGFDLQKRQSDICKNLQELKRYNLDS